MNSSSMIREGLFVLVHPSAIGVAVSLFSSIVHTEGSEFPGGPHIFLSLLLINPKTLLRVWHMPSFVQTHYL